MSELKTRNFRGTKLRDARKAKNWSQSKLARKIGAHVTSVSDWERGANAPSGRHIASLSRELGVKAESFYSDDDAEERDPMDIATAIELMFNRFVDQAVDRRFESLLKERA